MLFVGFLVMFFSSAVKNVFQVNFRSIADALDVSRGQLSISGSIFMLTMGVGSMVAGFLCDRVGPKRTILFGSAVAGLAFVTSAVSQSFPVFIGMYGVVAALALAGMQYVPMGVLVDQVFADRSKGIAYAALTNGTAIGFVVLSPLWVWLNVHQAWHTVFLWIGLFFILPLTLLIAFGLRVPEAVESAPTAKVATNWRGVLSSVEFYFLAVSFMGCGVNMAFIDIHFVPLMQDRGTDAVIVASTLSVLGIFEMIGAFVAGALAARAPYRILLSSFYFVRGLSVFMLAAAGTRFEYTIFAAIFGMTYLGTVIVTSLYCLRFFGKEVKGSVFGALWFVHQVGAFAAVALGGWARDAFGDYQAVVLVTGGISLFSAFVALLIPRTSLVVTPVTTETA